LKIVVDRFAQVDIMAPSRQQTDKQTEAYKMTAQDGVQIAILVFVAFLWMNLKMMGVI